MTFFLHSFILVLSFLCIFLWQDTPLSNYTAPILGVLIACYLVISLHKGGKEFLTFGGENPFGIFVLNTLIFIIIFSTGSINSILFFLLYFLAFGIAFVFEPSVTFIFVLGAILIFIPDMLKSDLTANLLKVGSLLLISPLAYFFGKEYRRSDNEEAEIEALDERTKEAADTISADVAEVLKDEKANLKGEDLEKLNEVLEETEDLRQESKQ
jgi:hypothetical protein